LCLGGHPVGCLYALIDRRSEAQWRVLSPLKQLIWTDYFAVYYALIELGRFLMSKIKSNIPILCIFLLALILRLISIHTHSLWYDEAFAVLFSEKGLSAMLYGTLAPVDGGAADIHPLLYYTTLNAWMTVFGQSAIILRLWSVILGLGTIGFVYLIGRDLFDNHAGLASAMVVAVAPFHVQYSQEIRMYSLLGFLLMSATWCFLQARQSNSKRWWIAFGLLVGLAMHTQQLAAFYLVAIGLVPFIARRRSDIIGVVLGAGIAFVVYLPWLVNIPGQLQKVNSYYWIAPPGGLKLLVTLRSFLSVQLDMPSPASIVAFVGAIFLFLFLMIQLVIYLRKPRRKTESDNYSIYFVLWLFAMPIGLMWLVSQVQPVYLERALLPSALMLYIALGWLFTRSGLPKIIAGVLIIVGLILSVWGLYYQYTWDTFPNSPFEQAVDFIAENDYESDVIVHMNKVSALPMIYYDRELMQSYIADIQGSSEDTLALPTQEVLNIMGEACIAQAVTDADNVWFVVFERVAQQYEAVGRTDLSDAIGWLDEQFTLENLYEFNDLQVYHYSDGKTDRDTSC
jgi:mannosyltransferase